MASASSVDLSAVIDERRIGGFQYGIAALCALVMFIDGFDTQAISYMAPLIGRDWQLPREALGPIFSAALTGLMVGYLVISPLSDRFGHKRMMVASTFLFGLFTLATVLAGGLTSLIVLRFLTGLGLGAAAPSAVALTGEYSPKRLRATFVLAIYCGFSLGFVAAGAAAGALLPEQGWRSLLWVGGVPPLLLTVLLALYLPESLEFLTRDIRNAPHLLALARRLDPTIATTADTEIRAAVRERGGAALGRLFSERRTLGTLLLWFVFVINLAEFYGMQSWLPAMLSQLHIPMGTVVAATTLTTVGGIVAAFVVGPAMDRIGPFGSIAILYFAGVACVALTGAALDASAGLLLTASFFAGFCVSGGQKSVIALAAVFYPAPIRSTGVGWALGIGRLGGIAGPLLVGGALALHWSPAEVFYAAAAPMLAAAVAVLVMGRVYGRQPVVAIDRSPAKDEGQKIGVQG